MIPADTILTKNDQCHHQCDISMCDITYLLRRYLPSAAFRPKLQNLKQITRKTQTNP